VAAESAIRQAIETHYGIRFTAPRTTDPVVEGAQAGPQKPRGAPARKRAPTEPEPPVVLLTKVKHSEDTPLPAPIAPSPQAASPILLTRRKERAEKKLAPPEPPLDALRGASNRDDIARVMLDYLERLTSRSLLLVVKRGSLVGQDGRGPRLSGDKARAISLALDDPSIFRDVIRSRLPYRGPLPDTTANRAFAERLRGLSEEVLLMPIGVRERIIAIVFADEPLMPLPDAALHATTREAGLAFERIILAGRSR
jgi:hypothetical protein